MMRRSLLLLTILILSVPMFGAEGQRSVLTEAGTYYSVSIVTLDPDSIPPKTALQLTTQVGEEVSHQIVPGSDEYGINFEPSLYWDEASATLLMFWVRMPSMMSSEVLFVSLGEDGWAAPTSITNGMFRFRKNLRIAATHYYETVDDEGRTIKLPGLAIHAVWWNEDASGSHAEYAILGFDQGTVTSSSYHTLTDLIDRAELQPSILHPDFDRSFFESPTITVHPESDAVEIIFGDWDLQVLHKLDLPPIVADGVLTIPIGVRGPEPVRPAYQFANAELAVEPAQLISGGPASGQLAVYWQAEGMMIFSRYKDGTWSETKRVLLNDHVSREEATRGLRRLVGRR
ncbi:MAG: hypothetical protein KY432_04585 [Acidobacteria bacterium]|nr:hypothetical protein [Acidobacteriota bacterium]